MTEKQRCRLATEILGRIYAAVERPEKIPSETLFVLSQAVGQICVRAMDRETWSERVRILEAAEEARKAILSHLEGSGLIIGLLVFSALLDGYAREIDSVAECLLAVEEER